MTVIGINFGHDAAATFIKEGKVIYSIEEEKISRIKQDWGWPKKAIAEGLKQTGLAPSEINVIAVGSQIYRDLGANEIRFRFSRRKADKWREYINRILSYFGMPINRFGESNKGVFEAKVREEGFINAKVVFYNHHLCHAAGAHYCSPFPPDMVITCDGHGDGEAFNFYMPDAQKGLVAVKINDYRTSVGALYSVITQILGFRPTRHEGKITGLAAFGQPGPLVDHFYQLFKLDGDSNLTRFPFDETDLHWNQYKIGSRLSLVQRINLQTSESHIGADYTKRYEVLLAKVSELCEGISKEDVAFAVQAVAERIVIEEIQRILHRHCANKKVKFALAGGVFANVRINQKIYELEAVENIFIQPAMGDAGLSIGAAILADLEFGNRKKDTLQYNFVHSYLGPDYHKELEAFLKRIGLAFTIEAMESPAKKIAQMLNDNLIVGFWHGKMEWGPRALGKRSMILNTFDRKVNDSLNKRLNRTEFMPFAPSVIDYMVKTYMPAYDETCPAADYMTITYDVDPQYHDLLQAVVHIDGTARPQVVKKETNPFFYDIIDEFYQLTGCGAIVNTSFNVHEEPIVSTPQSAFKALEDGRIDALVLDNFLILKVNGE